MKRQEKIDLKRSLSPVLASMFESDKRDLIGEYPFLEDPDELIEDDVEIDFEESSTKPIFETDLSWRTVEGEFNPDEEDSLWDRVSEVTNYRVELLKAAAVGEERFRGLYLYENETERVMIKQASRDGIKEGIIIVPIETEEQYQYLAKNGYIDAAKFYSAYALNKNDEREKKPVKKNRRKKSEVSDEAGM